MFHDNTMPISNKANMEVNDKEKTVVSSRQTFLCLPRPVLAGVPKGSLIVPLLYTIYKNDIS